MLCYFAVTLVQPLNWYLACRLLPQATWWTGLQPMWRPYGPCLRLFLPWPVAELLYHKLKPPHTVRDAMHTAGRVQ